MCWSCKHGKHAGLPAAFAISCCREALQLSPATSLPLLCCSVRWGEPYAGEGSDTFELSPDGTTLTQHTEMVSAATGQCLRYK